jgi:hypothetical protein
MKKEEMQFLAERIARHQAPPIIVPSALQPVDKQLLARTARRLRKSKSVLVGEKCSPVKQ